MRRDPDHRAANYQLGQLLQAAGEQRRAKWFLERAAALQKLAAIVDRSYDHPQDTRLMRSAAAATEELGRYGEAWAWARLAVQLEPGADWARATLARVRRPTGQRATHPERCPRSVPPASWTCRTTPCRTGAGRPARS